MMQCTSTLKIPNLNGTLVAIKVSGSLQECRILSHALANDARFPGRFEHSS
jgi:hypothetical protein